MKKSQLYDYKLNYNLLPILLFSFTILTVVMAQESAYGIFVAGSDMIKWDENRKLTWDDFQGNPYTTTYETSHPAHAGAVAHTYFIFDYSWQFTSAQECHYKFTNILAIAHFDRSKAWVRDGYVTDFVLKHEQGHFDIAQISADRFNERVKTELMGKEFPCPTNRSDSFINNHARNQVQGIFSDESQTQRLMQEDYDYETLGPADSSNSGQNEWNNKIQSLLDAGKDGRQSGGNPFRFLDGIILNIQVLFRSLFG
jgi:hypothetical protein